MNRTLYIIVNNCNELADIFNELFYEKPLIFLPIKSEEIFLEDFIDNNEFDKIKHNSSESCATTDIQDLIFYEKGTVEHICSCFDLKIISDSKKIPKDIKTNISDVSFRYGDVIFVHKEDAIKEMDLCKDDCNKFLYSKYFLPRNYAENKVNIVTLY